MFMATLIAVLISYLFGSISSAVLVSKLMHLPDPRSHGSQNPGATNVLRLGGKKAAILTLLGDTLKGLLPVLIAKWIGFTDLELSFIALGAFIGHLFPIFFKFQGGKGVATAFGCIIALSPISSMLLLAIWSITAIISRYSSLSSLVTAVTSPFVIGYFSNLYFAVLAIVIAILLIYRHRSNISKLMSGKESRIGEKKS